MTYTERSKKNIDAHIASTKGVKHSSGKIKGRREAAWTELKAFEVLVNASKF